MTDAPTSFPHRYICIDGPIAVGKTTLCNLLAEHTQGRTVLEEFNDNPFLKQFYQDPAQVAFQTQVYFLLARFKQQNALRQQDLFSRTIVSDYLFAKDRIFAYLNLEADELALYEKIYELIRPQLVKPDLVIYLQAESSVLLERLQMRGRDMEQEVQASYLENLTRHYNEYFQHYNESPLLILETSNADVVENPQVFNRICKLIEKTTEGTHRIQL